jgi:methyl coenzyme M reductase gamma subunit
MDAASVADRRRIAHMAPGAALEKERGARRRRLRAIAGERRPG